MCVGGMGVAISAKFVAVYRPGYGFDNETMCFHRHSHGGCGRCIFEEISADTCEGNSCNPTNIQESGVKVEGKQCILRISIEYSVN